MKFKSIVASVAAGIASLTLFAAPVQAKGECEVHRQFAQALQESTGQQATVECQEAPTPKRSGDSGAFLALALLAALGSLGWGYLDARRPRWDGWDYGFNSEPSPARVPAIRWEEEIFRWEDLEAPGILWWEDQEAELDTSGIEWTDLELDISDIQWWEDL